MILEARKSSEYKKGEKRKKEGEKKTKKKRKEKNKVVIQGKKSVLKNPGHL
ncbi:uncharacterized protein DS421_6g182510 [Arachis hypogaea]|nr:uncharacterized protein DS421_6g182510 [Arachis hypogaea]